MAYFRLKACTKCGGDLALDEGDWICLQCGTYYYVRLYPGADLGRQPRLERRLNGEKTVVNTRISPGPVGHRTAGRDTAFAVGEVGTAQHTMITAARPAVISSSGVVKQ